MNDSTSQYPLPRPAEDPRFTRGLLFDLGQLLTAHGYPPIESGADHVRLQQALFGFLYETGPEELS